MPPHYNARREREDQQTAMSIDPKGCFPIYLLVFRWPLPAAMSVSDHSTFSARDSSCRHGGPPAPWRHADMSFRRHVGPLHATAAALLHCAPCSFFFRELISAEVLRTCSMKSSLVSVVLFSIAAAGIDGRQRSVAFALPTCDSERPNSWATFRTLSIPNVPEFLGINNDDASSRWARALCCVYTHVEKSDRLSQAQMKTYDGSKYNIRADSFVEAARKSNG